MSAKIAVPISLLCFALGCDAYVVLTVEDPDRIAAGADKILLYEPGGEPSAYPLDGQDFPVNQTISAPPGSDRTLWVEAGRGDDAIAGRALVRLRFEAGIIGAATATLSQPCDDDAQCDDGVFSTGQERCVDRVCEAGTPPCAANVPCVDAEANDDIGRCVITPVHERCEPIETESGDLIATYCDAVAGCLPGEACDDEGALCAPQNACDAIRVCTSGRCVPQGELDVDDDNPCTIDLCDPEVGVIHIEDTSAVGNSCPLDGGSIGVCVDAKCQAHRCGDGLVEQDVEECDDGNLDNEDDCLTSCKRNICGDGFLNLATEECDDGNRIDEDACLATCVPNVCGDGQVNPATEECDDGNAQINDGCLPGCIRNVCGDGFLDPAAERCDDGNLEPFDGCGPDCSYVTWTFAATGALGQDAAPVTWSYNRLLPGTDGGTPDGGAVDGGTDGGSSATETVTVIGIATLDGDVIAVDARSGQELWRYASGKSFSAGLAVGNHGVYAVATDGTVLGFGKAGPNAAGNPRFSTALERSTTGALSVSRGYNSDSIFAVDRVGKVYRINSQTGAFQSMSMDPSVSLPYTRSTDPRDYMTDGGYDPDAGCVGCRVTLTNTQNSFASGQVDYGVAGFFVALDRGVWVYALKGNCAPFVYGLPAGVRVIGDVVFRGAPPPLDAQNVPVYFTTTDGQVRKISSQAGGVSCVYDPLDELASDVDFVATTAPVVVPDPYSLGELLVVGGGDMALHQFRVAPSRFSEVDGFPYPLGAALRVPVAAGFDYTLFAVDENGVVHAVSGLTGAPLWTYALGAQPAGSPLVAEGGVFVATQDGTLWALERGGAAAPEHWWSRQGGNAKGSATTPTCEQVGASSLVLWSLCASLLAWMAARRRKVMSPFRARKGRW